MGWLIDLAKTAAPEARRRKVLGMLGRDGVQYAVLVEDANTDPVVMAVATPGGVREVRIAKGDYDAFAIVQKVHGWDTGRRERDPASGTILITEAELDAARKGRIGVPGGEP